MERDRQIETLLAQVEADKVGAFLSHTGKLLPGGERSREWEGRGGEEENLCFIPGFWSTDIQNENSKANVCKSERVVTT